MLLVSGCGPDKEPDEIHSIRAYYCGPGAEGDEVGFTLEAVGDFEPTISTSEAISNEHDSVELGFPIRTRGVEVEAASGQDHWTGLGILGKDANIAFTLWPVRDPCLVFEPSEAVPFPRTAVGSALGYLPERRLLLIAGSNFPDGAPSGALAVDLDRGTRTNIPDIGTPLAFATITPFGPDALLVAGGADPANDVSPDDEARVFDAQKLEFQGQLIKLKKGRSKHGAVTLSNDETLLVGGVDDGGQPIGAVPEANDAVLEVVSPTDRASREEGLPRNVVARVSPTVIRLSDDRIFLGGGFSGPNPGDPPVTKLEWLSADASKLEDSVEVVLARAHSFAPMPGGAVLAVGLCMAATPGCTTDAERPRKSAAWIQPDHTIVDLPTIGAPLVFARLVAAADGSPWLFARTEKPNRDAWFVFNPWTGSFDQPVNEPLSGPIEPLGSLDELPPPISIDPGLFIWLEQTSDVLGKHARLMGFRFSTRNPYSRQVGSLLVADTQHIAPSVPPFGGSGLEFDQGLRLSGPTVQSLTGLPSVATLADTTYANVDISFLVQTSAEPRVLLAGSVLGGPECPWPEGTGDLLVSRRGTKITSSRDGKTTTCGCGSGRTSIAFAGPADSPDCKSGGASCAGGGECCSTECASNPETSQLECARTVAGITSVEIQRR